MSVAIVIPCYKVTRHIEAVAREAANYADAVYLVDDCCPDGTADLIRSLDLPAHVHLLQNPVNLGVGGAVIAGYRAALADGHDIMVKLDGDGQMPAPLIPYLVAPIASGQADYVKGNRFYNVRDARDMPTTRLLGNAGLSFLTKLATGYWTIFDPTNGFTAIHARIVERLSLDRIAKRYFFESDMLFRLGTMRAHVVDMPMTAVYGDEKSNLNVGAIALPFLFKNLGNFFKRLFYNYFLRDFSVASMYLVLLAIMLPLGLTLGALFWNDSLRSGVAATSGEVMLAALPLILATQMLLAFLAYDVEATPKRALHPMMPPRSPETPPEISNEP